jgi:hypothetical protein
MTAPSGAAPEPAPPAAPPDAPAPLALARPPGRRTRWRWYLSSFPERLGRATAVVLGGMLYEVSGVLLPAFVRNSRIYQATVARVLRLTVELLGGVGGVFEADPIPARSLLARKTAGNAVELASILAVGWSPLWLLAAAADLSGGSRAYLRALEAELKGAGLIPAQTDVSTVEELLSRVETTSAVLADTIDIPPVRLADAVNSWTTLRRQAADLPTAAALAALGAQLQEVARAQGRPMGEVARALGSSAARAGGRLGTRHVVDYYQEALQRIAAEGLEAYLRRTSGPYLRRVRGHLDPAAPTHTERLLRRARRTTGRMQQRWRRLRDGPAGHVGPAGQDRAPPGG